MKHSVIILCLIMLLSCGREPEHIEQQPISGQFPICAARNDSAKALPVEVKVKEWALSGDTLYLLSTERNNFINEISLDDMSLISSYGTIGQGPGEYIFPRLISSERGGMFLGDAALGVLQALSDSLKDDIICLNQQIPMNNAYLLNDTSLVYVLYSPNGTRLIVRDLATDEALDSMPLPVIPFANSEMSTPAFHVGTNGKYIVVAYQGADRFDIIGQSESRRLGSTIVFQGDAPLGNQNFFFIDLACGENYFALLSMKNKDVTHEESYPGIEIYDYQGNPIAKISIDFLAYRILIDDKHNRLLLLSATDDNVHMIDNNINS